MTTGGDAYLVYLLLVGYVAAGRAGELAVSKKNRAAMLAGGGGVRDSPPDYRLMVAVHATWLVALVAEPLLTSAAPGTASPAAAALFTASQALRVWTLETLGAAWNTRVVHPADDGFVTGGPYAYVRHPNYLAVILEFATLPLVGGAYVTAVVWSALNAAVLVRRLRDEESSLAARPGYEKAFAGIPRLAPWPRRKPLPAAPE